VNRPLDYQRPFDAIGWLFFPVSAYPADTEITKIGETDRARAAKEKFVEMIEREGGRVEDGWLKFETVTCLDPDNPSGVCLCLFLTLASVAHFFCFVVLLDLHQLQLICPLSFFYSVREFVMYHATRLANHTLLASAALRRQLDEMDVTDLNNPHFRFVISAFSRRDLWCVRQVHDVSFLAETMYH
jgi:hypothetical protein